MHIVYEERRFHVTKLSLPLKNSWFSHFLIIYEVSKTVLQENMLQLKFSNVWKIFIVFRICWLKYLLVFEWWL